MPIDPTLTAHIATRDAEFRRDCGDPTADTYLPLLQDRAAAFDAHLASMAVTPDLVHWALAASATFGPYVKVHHYIADWLTALLVLRYGEEPDAAKTWDNTGWPGAFTADDRKRANELLTRGNWPASLTALEA